MREIFGQEKAAQLEGDAGVNKSRAVVLAHMAKQKAYFCALNASIPSLASKADSLAVAKVESERKYVDAARGSLAMQCEAKDLCDAIHALGSRPTILFFNFFLRGMSQFDTETMKLMVTQACNVKLVVILMGPTFMCAADIHPAVTQMESCMARCVLELGMCRVPLLLNGFGAGKATASLLFHGSPEDAFNNESFQEVLSSLTLGKGVLWTK